MKWTLLTFVLLLATGFDQCNARPQQQSPSERLLDLGSLFNRYPSYGQRPLYGGYGGYGNSNFYPGGYQSGGGGYPNNNGNFYPGSGGLGTNFYPGSSGLGTNFLGSSNGFGSSGYGGYGGFGGNGGLNSYFGYDNNNYNGQRNLGYGYYRNSDSYGFLPSRDSNIYSRNGYRGYN